MNTSPPGIERAKNITRASLKRFGPLLLTGLAAVAEHHLLKKDDDKSSSSTHNSNDDKADPTVKELKFEVKKLRRKLQKKRKYRDESSFTSSTSGETVEEVYRYSKGAMRDKGKERRGNRPLEEEPLYQQQTMNVENEPGYYRMHPAPDPPQQYERYATFIPATQVQSQEEEEPSSKDVHQESRRHIHRHESLTAPAHDFISQERSALSREGKQMAKDFGLRTSSRSVHAGQVAAVAGIIEVLHVEVEDKGHWYGRKGLRVGTTLAASYGASLSRDKDPEDVTGLQSAIDVGKGLAVSRMVHGRLSNSGGTGWPRT